MWCVILGTIFALDFTGMLVQQVRTGSSMVGICLWVAGADQKNPNIKRKRSPAKLQTRFHRSRPHSTEWMPWTGAIAICSIVWDDHTLRINLLTNSFESKKKIVKINICHYYLSKIQFKSFSLSREVFNNHSLWVPTSLVWNNRLTQLWNYACKRDEAPLKKSSTTGLT